ncbi:MAG: class I SAM-dependent rRNA methyltransferase, partial [Bacteroidales bacterium]|nr:class I SAM-dependent rRNA methyltransferase [Bacteroidales bacterium]
MRATLHLAPGKDKAVMRRHPWLFSGAVRRVEGNPQEGDLVDVVAADGRWLAVGHYQSDSIICKVLSFDTQHVDETFYRERLQSAIAYRERMGFFDTEETNVFRLVHAEGDFMPGLVCDWYNGVLVMQAHSVGMHRLFPMFTQLFVDLLGRHGIKSVFDKSSSTVPGGCEDGYVWGDEPDEWEICEHGNRLLINFFEGQKTGFFVDQRENRHLVETLSAGRRVLNCFGYTGGFSLGALRGGAGYVETVDISKKAIELCNRNVLLNFGKGAPHKGVVADVLKYLDEVDNQFDIIILDPPAFAKNHRSLQQGLKGYRNINQKAMEKIQPGGLLMTFSCSQA